jgi:WD40 repeat protein
VQSPALSTPHLIIGGENYALGLIDLRSSSRLQSHFSTDSLVNPFVKLWTPAWTESTDITQPRQSNAMPPSDAVSVSGLAMSKDGERMVCSFQGDQIYTFSVRGRECDNLLDTNFYISSMSTPAATSEVPLSRADLTNESISGVVSTIGGHINAATFLKSVSFFGPNDEYVVSGSDDGHMWIWESNATTMPLVNGEIRFASTCCRVVGVSPAGERVVQTLQVQWLVSYICK